MMSPLQQSPFAEIQNLNHEPEESYIREDSCFQILMSSPSFWDEEAVDEDYDTGAAIQCLDLIDILCNKSSINLSEDFSEDEEEDEEIRLICEAAIYTGDFNSPASHQFFAPRSRSPPIGNRPAPVKEQDNLVEEPPRVVRRLVSCWDEAKKENIYSAPSRPPVLMTMTPPPTVRRLPIDWSHCLHEDTSPPYPAGVTANTHEQISENTVSMLRHSAQVNMQAQETKTAELASSLSFLRLQHSISICTIEHASKISEKADSEVPVATANANDDADLTQRLMRRAKIAKGFQQKREDIFINEEDLANICKVTAMASLKKKRASYKSTLVGPAVASERMARVMPRRQTVHVAIAA
jgi:hypothetical protein